MYLVLCVLQISIVRLCLYCETPAIKWAAGREGVSLGGVHPQPMISRTPFYLPPPETLYVAAHFIGFLSLHGFYKQAGYFGHKPPHCTGAWLQPFNHDFPALETLNVKVTFVANPQQFKVIYVVTMLSPKPLDCRVGNDSIDFWMLLTLWTLLSCIFSSSSCWRSS